MRYKVIFDLSQTGYHHWLSWIYTLFIIIPTIGFIFYQAWVGWGSLTKTVPIALFLCFFSLFVIVMGVVDIRNYLSLKEGILHSQCQVTEGTVSQFQWLPADSDCINFGESFVVNGFRFSYQEGSMQNGFNQTGIIRNGLQVRIYHINQDIARLEVAQ